MPALNFVSRVPNSPFLNENWYIVWGVGGATYTAAFTSVGSFVSEIRSSGGSFVSFYPAGTVATGTWTVKGYLVKGSTGTYNHSASITIRNSEIPDPAKSTYDILRQNVGNTYSSTVFTTGWFSARSTKPMVTVTRGGRNDLTMNLGDTFREHEETIFVDSWVPDNSPASPFFGATGYKHALTLLDDEIKRIVNSTRFSAGNKLWHMKIVRSTPADEVADARRIFRTRHTIKILWGESIA